MQNEQNKDFEKVQLMERSSYAEIYTKMKETNEKCEEDIKKIYHQSLTIWFDTTCLQMDFIKMKRFTEKYKYLIKNTENVRSTD